MKNLLNKIFLVGFRIWNIEFAKKFVLTLIGLEKNKRLNGP